MHAAGQRILRQLIQTVTARFCPNASARQRRDRKTAAPFGNPLMYEQDTFKNCQFPRSINQPLNGLFTASLMEHRCERGIETGENLRYSPEKISSLPTPLEEDASASIPAALENRHRGKYQSCVSKNPRGPEI